MYDMCPKTYDSFRKGVIKSQKAKSVVDFLAKCQQLSDTIRTGWDDWHVNRERLESIAAHIFEVAIFAILMKSQYEYDVDIMKVVYMTVIHELGEIKIGDYTPFQITREEKTRIERAAVHDMLKDRLDGPEIEALFLEFDAHETAEAKLAYQCDKAIACLKSKWYDEEGCVDLAHQEGCQAIKDPLVQSLLQNGESWSNMFIKYTLQKIDFDDNFREVLNYTATHRMHQDD